LAGPKEKIMTTRSTGRAAAHALVADDYADEVSSVRAISALDLQLGVTVDAFALDRSFDDPTPVYARPYSMTDGERIDSPRQYFLGTRFDGGIVEGATWEDEMRADDTHEFVITKCGGYLRDNAF